MHVVLKSEIQGIEWRAVKSLFDSVGWCGRTENEIRETFGLSSFVRFAFADEVLVGCGRVISDLYYYSWIVDLVVHPDFQRHRIGSMILKDLSDQLKDIRNIALVASDSVVGFYERHGWTRQADATMRLHPHGKQDSLDPPHL